MSQQRVYRFSPAGTASLRPESSRATARESQYFSMCETFASPVQILEHTFTPRALRTLAPHTPEQAVTHRYRVERTADQIHTPVESSNREVLERLEQTIEDLSNRMRSLSQTHATKYAEWKKSRSEQVRAAAKPSSSEADSAVYEENKEMREDDKSKNQAAVKPEPAGPKGIFERGVVHVSDSWLKAGGNAKKEEIDDFDESEWDKISLNESDDEMRRH